MRHVGWPVRGHRQLRDRALIAVDDRDAIRVPAFVVTADGEPRPELRPLLQEVRAAGIDGRTAATWLTSRSSELSGAAPEQVARTDPARAASAAARFAVTRKKPGREDAEGSGPSRGRAGASGHPEAGAAP